MNEKQSQPVPSVSAPQGTKQGGPRILLPVLLVLVFTIFGAIYWVMVTESGQKAWESLGSGSKMAAEKEAAASLQKRGVVAIAEPPDQRITSVNFAGTPVSDESLAEVSKLYRVLTVNLSDSKMSDDQIHYIAHLPQVATLLLTNTPVTDAGVKQLGTSNVKNLYLNGTNVTDQGLEDVAKMSSIQVLNLSKTKVTDKGLKPLLSLNNLVWLLLSDTDITDSGLDALAGMKSLHHLTVGNTKVTPEGIKRMKDANPKLTIDN